MTHRCLIIPAALQKPAQALYSKLYGDGGDGMFVTGLSPTGTAPATHYVSSGHIKDAAVDLLPCLSVTTDAEGLEVVTLKPGKPDDVLAKAQEAGFTTTKAKVSALFAAMDVSDQDPFAAFERRGLKLVQAAL